MSNKLECKVQRVLYPAATEVGATWFVLSTDKGKASGSMSWRPEEGEHLSLDGQWGSYNGEKNYKFKSAMPNVPVDPADLLAYACERTKGIGDALRRAIWAECGPEWEANIGMTEIKGFSQAKRLAFEETMNTIAIEAEKSQAIAWLMSKGATVNMATLAFDEWLKDTIGVINNNCYRLADLANYGFNDVDKVIRRNFGIGDDDPRRIRAAIIYKLVQSTSSGSTVVDWTDLREAACALVGNHNASLVCSLVTEMFKDGALKGFPGSESIALGQDYRNELLIWDWMKEGAA